MVFARTTRTLRRSIAALGLLALSAGCGGDEGPASVQVRGGGPPGAAPPPPAKVEKLVVPEGRHNEQWDKVKVYFLGVENDPSTGYVRAPVGTYRDPFEPRLVTFVPRVELPEEQAPDEVDSEPIVAPLPDEDVPVALQVGPTQRYPAHDYNVMLIRWGTSVNKAVVADPEGQTFVITRDMKLGNNNGRVIDITRYDVTVKEDSRDEPIVLSIQPEILRISEQQGPTERLFTNAIP